MTLTHTNQGAPLYPGMMDEKVEFFAVEGGLKFIQGGQTKCTTNLPYALIQLGNEEIARQPEVEVALKEWHPNSEFKRLQQFLKCRYGGLDFSADMENNQFKEGDYWDCPKRKACQFNGLICKAPKINNQELSALEIQLIKLKCTTLTNDVIALELKLPLGSFHKASKILHTKLGVQTRQEVAVIAKSLNLI